MEKLCCISVTLAARFIGAFDLSASILAINFIAREFFSDEHRSIAFDDIQIFLGLSWANTSINSQQRYNHKWILVYLMVFSAIHLISSAGLILATIFRKKSYATPWLIFEVISLASQAGGVTVHIFQQRCDDKMALAGPAYVPTATLYFFLGVYLWIVVFAAQRSWPTGESEIFLESNKSFFPEPHVVTLNSLKTPKTPDYSILESPEPPRSSKYYEI